MMPNDWIEVEVEQSLTPEVILFNDSRSLPQSVVALHRVGRRSLWFDLNWLKNSS